MNGAGTRISPLRPGHSDLGRQRKGGKRLKLRDMFHPKADEGVRLPDADRPEGRQPRIGDDILDIRAASTHGYINLRNLADEKWLVLFSHPAPFTSVCSTELAAFAAKLGEFETRRVALVGICRSTVEEQERWHRQIKSVFGVDIGFPIICDRSGTISELLGMVHPLEDTNCAIRKTMVVDPSLKIRLIQEYPIAVGRSTDETLRAVDALQATREFDLLAGADWEPGEAFLLPPDIPDAVARRRYGQRLREINSYIKTVSLRMDGAL